MKTGEVNKKRGRKDGWTFEQRTGARIYQRHRKDHHRGNPLIPRKTYYIVKSEVEKETGKYETHHVVVDTKGCVHLRNHLPSEIKSELPYALMGGEECCKCFKLLAAWKQKKTANIHGDLWLAYQNGRDWGRGRRRESRPYSFDEDPLVKKSNERKNRFGIQEAK